MVRRELEGKANGWRENRRTVLHRELRIAFAKFRQHELSRVGCYHRGRGNKDLERDSKAEQSDQEIACEASHRHDRYAVSNRSERCMEHH